MSKQKEYKVGIYVRLSNEDTRAGESVSIENQKLLLTKHVQEQGWELAEVYCDDGFTGTNQKRPALQRMLQDVKQGHINTILIKDLSRLGRNYLEVGNLAEITLPHYGCELISLNEKLDDMMVFRNWFNEQHSKQTSQKVRAVRKICAESGKFLGTYAPYGYNKSPDDKHVLIIDERTAPTVRKIFNMRVTGASFRAIALHLNELGIISPLEYYYQNKGRPNPKRTNRLWNDVTVKLIIRNEAYIGNMVQLKTGTISYKNHTQVGKPKEEWVRKENTHEPLIPIELWNRTQALDKKNYKPRSRSDGTSSIFSGLLFCMDCGFKMKNQNERRFPKDREPYKYSSYLCGNYVRSGKSACTPHTIGEEVLKELVLTDIRKQAKLLELDEKNIVERILRLRDGEAESARNAYFGEIKAHRDRLSLLEQLIAKLYEDRLSGIIPEPTFRSLIQKYEQERVDRVQMAENLEKRIKAIRQDTDDVKTWAKLIREFTKAQTLDGETLLLLIDRINIGAASHIDGKKVRDIEIIYNYVGNVEFLSGSPPLNPITEIASPEVNYERAV